MLSGYSVVKVRKHARLSEHRPNLHMLDDDQWRVEGYVWFAERGDDMVASPIRRTKINEQNLILVVVDYLGQLGPEAHQINVPELTLEY